jgi:hypothetical protein
MTTENGEDEQIDARDDHDTHCTHDYHIFYHLTLLLV